MVAKLTVRGVVDLTCCLSYEQPCGKCNVKVLREGGGGACMTAQGLHVTNQGQSVQKRVKEGMRGRTIGLANRPPPWCLWGDLGAAPLMTSFVFK